MITNVQKLQAGDVISVWIIWGNVEIRCYAENDFHANTQGYNYALLTLTSGVDSKRPSPQSAIHSHVVTAECGRVRLVDDSYHTLRPR